MIAGILCALIGAAFGFWTASIITSTRSKELQARFERLRAKAQRYALDVLVHDRRAEEG
jgi:hypothetical protein